MNLTTQPSLPGSNPPWILILLGLLGISVGVGAGLFLMMNKSEQELPLNGVAIEGNLAESDRIYMDLAENFDTYADYSNSPWPCYKYANTASTARI